MIFNYVFQQLFSRTRVFFKEEGMSHELSSFNKSRISLALFE